MQALEAGAHVLVEKPAGVSVAQVDALAAAAERAGRLVKVGFNHRFHPGIARAAEEVHSGRWGEVMHVRGRYGHGGRVGYDREWRAEPARSGGGELIDQGMHLIDLTHWIARPAAAALRAAAHALLGHAGGRQRGAAARRGQHRARRRGRRCT